MFWQTNQVYLFGVCVCVCFVCLFACLYACFFVHVQSGDFFFVSENYLTSPSCTDKKTTSPWQRGRGFWGRMGNMYHHRDL